MDKLLCGHLFSFFFLHVGRVEWLAGVAPCSLPDCLPHWLCHLLVPAAGHEAPVSTRPHQHLPLLLVSVVANLVDVMRFLTVALICLPGDGACCVSCRELTVLDLACPWSDRLGGHSFVDGAFLLCPHTAEGEEGSPGLSPLLQRHQSH